MTLYDNTLAASSTSRDTIFAAEFFASGLEADGFVTNQSGLPLRWSGSTVSAQAGIAGAAAKRALDVLGALAGLVALLPLLIIIAFLIKVTSQGPVFFRQQREGLNGRLFGIYKFRSMRADLGDQSGVRQTVGNDPRVTPLGRFMRRTSIDELPQLINVLIGDMSLVGPRPHVPGMLADGTLYRGLVPYYDQRHSVKPGLTGWAQVNGLRGPTTSRSLAVSRVHHDLAYIQNWSVVLDFKILFLTVWRELRGGTGS